MKIATYRITDAGNLIFYTQGNEPNGTAVKSIATLPASERQRDLATCKVRHKWYDPSALPSSARDKLAEMGIVTLGDLAAQLSTPHVRKVIKNSTCYGWRDYIDEIMDSLAEVPALFDEDYVAPVILQLPRKHLSITPRAEEHREIWDNLDKADQEEVIEGLMETMEGVFFDLLHDQLAVIYDRKVQEAQKELEALKAEAARWS